MGSYVREYKNYLMFLVLKILSRKFGKISAERKRLENPHKYKVDLSEDLIRLKYDMIKLFNLKY